MIVPSIFHFNSIFSFLVWIGLRCCLDGQLSRKGDGGQILNCTQVPFKVVSVCFRVYCEVCLSRILHYFPMLVSLTDYLTNSQIVSV